MREKQQGRKVLISGSYWEEGEGEKFMPFQLGMKVGKNHTVQAIRTSEKHETAKCQRKHALMLATIPRAKLERRKRKRRSRESTQAKGGFRISTLTHF